MPSPALDKAVQQSRGLYSQLSRYPPQQRLVRQRNNPCTRLLVPVFYLHNPLEEDLLRRDLTINAIAEDENGQLIDPYHGLDDIKDRILRHVSPAFAEDPVRILRVARFAARFANLGFRVAPETNQLMRDMVNSGEVDALVAERVWQEVERALAEKHPEVFFQVLRDCGALQRLFPEIDNLFGVPQPEKWHPEIDCGLHTMMVLQQAAKLSDNIAVRFAALVHD